MPVKFASKSPTALSQLPLSLLHTPLDSPQHLSRQHEIDRPEEWTRQHPEQPWPVVDPCPQDQPCRASIHFVEDEHPAKLAVNLHLWVVTHKTWNDVAHMRVGREGKHPVLLQGRDSEESRTRRPVEHDIAG